MGMMKQILQVATNPRLVLKQGKQKQWSPSGRFHVKGWKYKQTTDNTMLVTKKKILEDKHDKENIYDDDKSKTD